MLVSAIIPCRNEIHHIRRMLESVLSNDFPPDEMEIIVVDGMSTDGTREVVQEYSDRFTHIRLLDNPRAIVPTAMNIGVRAAAGEYIMRLDCHAMYTNDYISKCVEVIRRTNADNVGGYMTTLPGRDTPTARAIAATTSCRFGIGNSMFRLSGPEQEADTVPFGMFRRDVFDRVGLYNERLVRNQDIELNSRLKRAGGRVIISPQVKLSYFNRATYAGLWQQAYNNGLWNPYTIWLVGSGLSLRHFVPMVFVVSLTVLGVGGLLFRALWFLLAAEVASYAVSLAPAAKASPLRLLWAFATLHLGYGIGSLWGLISIPFKFCNCRNATGMPLADRKT